MQQESRTKELLAKGMAFPCAVCVKMWAALDKGSEVCEVGLNGTHCGGPMVGMSFPFYEGALSRDVLVKFCFRCGDPASKLVEPTDGGIIGVCEKHLSMLDIVGRR
jgi:hypothetical protein